MPLKEMKYEIKLDEKYKIEGQKKLWTE